MRFSSLADARAHVAANWKSSEAHYILLPDGQWMCDNLPPHVNIWQKERGYYYKQVEDNIWHLMWSFT